MCSKSKYVVEVKSNSKSVLSNSNHDCNHYPRSLSTFSTESKFSKINFDFTNSSLQDTDVDTEDSVA